MHPNAPIPYVAKHLSSRDLILWVDVETTGADPATALPLEIAAAITNLKGDIVSEIKHRRWIYPRSWRGMLEAETAMHAGWIEECLSDTVRWPCVPRLDMDLFNLWIDAHVTAELEPKRALRLPLGGKNVGYDRSVLLRPDLVRPRSQPLPNHLAALPHRRQRQPGLAGRRHPQTHLAPRLAHRRRLRPDSQCHRRWR